MRLAPKPLDISDCERLELEQLTNRHNTPQQLALRAKIILLASEGKSHRSIARILDIDTDMNPADGDLAVGMTKMTALGRYEQRGGWHGLLSHQS